MSSMDEEPMTSLNNSRKTKNKGRPSAVKARQAVVEALAKCRPDPEEADLSFEDSEDEYTVPGKRKHLETSSSSSSEDDDLMEPTVKRRRPGPKSRVDDEDMALAKVKRRRPGPKSRTSGQPAPPRRRQEKILQLRLVKVDRRWPDSVLHRKLEAWANPKVHKCSICHLYGDDDDSGASAVTLSGLISHLDTEHSMKLQDYKENIDESLEISMLPCQLCQKDVMQSADALDQHLAQSHQAYNLKKYFRTFVLHLLPLDFAANGGSASADVEKDDNKENQEIKKEENKDPKKETKTCAILPETLKLFAVSDYPSSTNQETACDDSAATRGPVRIDFCRLCGDVVKQDAESLNSHYESTHATERDKLVRTWSQQVSFHPCAICGHKPETMRSVKDHASRKHGMSIEDYVVRHARETDIFAKPPARHSCVVCYASVLHDRGHLMKHFAEDCKQKMSLADYYDKHVRNSTAGRPNAGGGVHSSRHYQSRDEPVVQKVDQVVQDACKKWRFACEWQCNKCLEVKEQFCQIKQHMKSAHSSNVLPVKTVEGTQTHPLVKKPKIHPCKLCGVKLLQESAFLTPHFAQEHKMDVMNYFEEHVYDPDTM